MTNWIIKPCYKYDLANLCNLLTEEEVYHQAHPEAWSHFAPLFSRELQQRARAFHRQGILLGPSFASLLACSDYDGADIEQIVAALEPAKQHPVFAPYSEHFPLVDALLRHVHELGAFDYWQERCLPTLERRCDQLSKQATTYDVVQAADEMLGEGYASGGSGINLYVSHFSAPHGVSLRTLAFLSDQRWDLKTHVAIALHELMHPPFDRELINELADRFRADPFFQEAKARLPLSSGYATPAAFLEENLVEGAHVYLAERLGVLDDPLQYFIRHDYASHVVSALVYQALKQGVRERSRSFREAVELMIDEGLLTPGRLREQYCRLYEANGLQHPY